MKKLLTAFAFLASSFSLWADALPRPEYPRPQFERAAWVNLNGTWNFDFDFGQSGRDRKLQNADKLDKQITVPFCPESKLSGIQHLDFINCVWYQRKISVPAEWAGKKIFLNFGAVDYETEVYLDGRLIQRHYGGSSSFAVDLTRFVKAGQTHNLVLQVKDRRQAVHQLLLRRLLLHPRHGHLADGVDGGRGCQGAEVGRAAPGHRPEAAGHRS